MALNLVYEFLYFRHPTIGLRLTSNQTDSWVGAEALIDTGAEATLIDERVASELGIDLTVAPSMFVSGVGGEIVTAKLAEVEVQLLGQSELTFIGVIGFAPQIEAMHGNLLGLDVLGNFDIGLSHANRTGYLGVASPP